MNVNRAARQPDASQQHENDGHDKAVNRMRIPKRIERKIALLLHREIAGAIGDDGVAVFVERDGKNPSDHDEEKALHVIRKWVSGR